MPAQSDFSSYNDVWESIKFLKAGPRKNIFFDTRKVKAVIKGVRWLQGSVAGTLGSGIVVNVLNVTNSNKNCGVVTQTANSIAVGAAHSSGVAVLAEKGLDPP